MRSTSRHIIVAVAGAAILSSGAPLPAAAVVLPPSTFEESTGATSIGDEHGLDPYLPETVSFANSIPSLAAGAGWATALGGALPRAEGQISITSDTNFRDIWGGSYASVNYYFYLEQLGGTPVTEQIPIDIVTRGGISASASEHAGVGDVYAHATVYIDTHDVDVPQGVHSCIPAPCSGTPKSFEYAFTGYAVPEQEIRVSLIASMSGAASRRGATFSAHAWVDPRIEISHTYARRDDFRIVFSDGVTPVPEPSTFSMGGAGLVALACGLGRRRRRGR